MKYLKNLGKSLLYTFGVMIVLTFIITIFSYFNLFSDSITKVFKLLIPIISLFVGGILVGRCANKKGYIEGIKFGIIVDLIFVIFSFFIKTLKVSSIIFYIILLISSIFGSMIGINKKKK